MTGVMSAANEQAVEMFLQEKIGYLDIVKVVSATCDKHRADLVLAPSLDDIVQTDLWAREYVKEIAGKNSPVIST